MIWRQFQCSNHCFWWMPHLINTEYDHYLSRCEYLQYIRDNSARTGKMDLRPTYSLSRKFRSWSVCTARKGVFHPHAHAHGTKQKNNYRCDSTSPPSLFSFCWCWPSGPASVDAAVEPPSSDLQRGHSALILSHLSMHSMWKTCPQGSSRRSSLFENLDKQMQQTWKNPEDRRCQLITQRGTNVYAWAQDSTLDKCKMENGWETHGVFRGDSSLLVGSRCQNSAIVFPHFSSIADPHRLVLVRHQRVDYFRGSTFVQIQILVEAYHGDYAGQATAYHRAQDERQCIADEAECKEHYTQPEKWLQTNKRGTSKVRRNVPRAAPSNTHLYKLGASWTEERPPNIHTFPTTNHTAKKQSKANFKHATNA